VFAAKKTSASQNVLVVQSFANMVDEQRRIFTICYFYVAQLNQHPNLINPIEAFDDGPQLWVISEPCAALLSSLVEHHEQQLPEGHVAFAVSEVLKALQVLHPLRYVHLNIRADRIAVFPDGHCKLLGPAETHLGLPEKERVNRAPRTHWTAPEVLQRVGLTAAADIWAVGCLAMEVAELTPPYGEHAIERAAQLLLSKGAPKLRQLRWSMEFNQFVSECLQMDPMARPNATAAMQHPWVTRSVSAADFLQSLRSRKTSLSDSRQDVGGWVTDFLRTDSDPANLGRSVHIHF